MSPSARSSAGRTLAVVGAAGLGGALVVATYTTFRIWRRGDIDDAARPVVVDAIVVLGAAQHDGRPSPVFRARIDHAVDLWRTRAAGSRRVFLVVTGGRRAGDRTTEAATARAYAIERGVPEDAILMEERGRSTLESLRGVAPILDQRGRGPTLFVSDRSHMLRVIRMARDLGIDALGSPVPASPLEASVGGRLDALLHELAALAWYGVTGQPGPARELSAGEPSGGRKTPSWPVGVPRIYSPRCCARTRRAHR